MKRIVIVEDQTAVREMLVEVISADPNYEIIGEAGDGQSAYDVCLKTKPDLIILDAMLPGLNGTEVLRRLGRRLRKLRVLVFSAYRNASLVRGLLQAGAQGFVEKTASLREFRKGMESVANGGSYFGPEITRLLREAVVNPESPKQAGVDTLTTREREILQLVAESYSTKEIAQKLTISVKTADNHRTNLMRKLDLHNIASLTRYAISNGLVESPVTAMEN